MHQAETKQHKIINDKRKKSFDNIRRSVWEVLSDDYYSYAGDASPEEMLGDNGSAVIPPEKTVGSRSGGAFFLLLP